MSERDHGIVIVGCGVISATHRRAITQLPNARLVAVVDVVPERAKLLGEQAGVPALTDLDEALATAADVVCVCVPSGLHAEIGIRAARAGKHVVVEKPVDVTIAAADRLITSCRDAGVKLTVISQRRFEPAFRRAYELVHEGFLGPLVLAGAQLKWWRSQEYYESAEWRGTRALDGGGALMNQGVHYVDLLRWILGPVEWISAVCETKAHHDIEVEDIALAHIKFASGVLASVDASTAVFPGLKERLELTGTLGSMVLEAGALTLLETRDGSRTSVAGKPSSQVGNAEAGSMGAAADPAQIAASGHVAQLGDFLAAIDEDREPAITGADGRAAIELILGVYESARLGQRVLVGNANRN